VCARYQPPGNVRGSFEENLQILDEVEEENENEDGTTGTRIVKKVRERERKPKKEDEEDRPARPHVEIGLFLLRELNISSLFSDEDFPR